MNNNIEKLDSDVNNNENLNTTNEKPILSKLVENNLEHDIKEAEVDKDVFLNSQDIEINKEQEKISNKKNSDYTVSNQNLKELIFNKGNCFCADCYSENVRWGNTTFGVFLCLDCALNHKNVFLDTHENIKSIEVNNWNGRDILAMTLGGNDNFNNYLRSYNIEPTIKNIKEKYLHKATLYYIDMLTNAIEGKVLTSSRPDLEEGIKEIDLKDLEANKRFDERFSNFIKDATGFHSKEEKKALAMMEAEVNKKQRKSFNNENEEFTL